MATAEGLAGNAMFITICYGADLSFLANPECTNKVLLEHIREKCAAVLEEQDVVDVSDMQGKVKHLRRFPLEYGQDFFQTRETAILLKIKQDDDHSKYPKFVPLLDNKVADKDFMRRLNSRSSARSAYCKTPESDDGTSSRTTLRKSANQKSRTTPRRGSRSGSVSQTKKT